jgi:hypothetical protein
VSAKATVFIGSSREGLLLANGGFSELERASEPTVWDQAFAPTRGTLEDLMRRLPVFDFAVLILTPDDLRVSRGQEAQDARDNVIFELGICLGALGRDRVFFLKPRDVQLALPSDLAGVTPLEYVARGDCNQRLAVRTACGEIKGQIAALGPRVAPSGGLGEQAEAAQRGPDEVPFDQLIVTAMRLSPHLRRVLIGATGPFHKEARGVIYADPDRRPMYFDPADVDALLASGFLGRSGDGSAIVPPATRAALVLAEGASRW